MTAMLTASALRVDVAGVPALDGLSLTTSGDHTLVLSAARALFEAAAGLRPPVRGDLRVCGETPQGAVRARLMACAPLDPPLPLAWTVQRYVTWSARLAGHGRAEATERAAEALDEMQLSSSAAARLPGAVPSLRRAVVLAAAMATGAPVLLVDDPLVGLPEDAARPLARLIARALGRRRSIVFAARVALESPLALAADEAIVVDGSEVAAQGAPAEVAAAERSLLLRVAGDVAAFARAVERQGGHAVVTTRALAPSHVRVDLGPLAARDVLRLALEAEAVVMELRPISGAFA